MWKIQSSETKTVLYIFCIRIILLTSYTFGNDCTIVKLPRRKIKCTPLSKTAQVLNALKGLLKDSKIEIQVTRYKVFRTDVLESSRRSRIHAALCRLVLSKFAKSE